MTREILIGVTGGVAAFKTAALVSGLVKDDYGVSVVMTRNARRFVGPATFAALTGRPVVCRTFDRGLPLAAHIELARRAELFCVAPATANLLAKAAQGIADDLLTTLLLSFAGTVLLAPAMNCQMWAHPTVKRNVAQLREDGVHLIDPQEGWLSCRDEGAGRMAEPAAIAERIAALLPDRAT